MDAGSRKKLINHQLMDIIRNYIICLLLIFSFVLNTSCSVNRQLKTLVKTNFTHKDFLASANIGISVYNPSSKKFLYILNGDNYFIPASNTKLFTCYAAMKFLGDSLEGIRYYIEKDTLYIIPTGDPTFLHPDFATQPVLNFLKENKAYPIAIANNRMEVNGWGYGWSWDDYEERYMPERSALPVFGDVVKFSKIKNQLIILPFLPDWKINYSNSEFSKIKRKLTANEFTISSSFEGVSEVPFYSDNGNTNRLLLEDSLGIAVNSYSYLSNHFAKPIYSQPTDSMLKIMMHTSDNFFAEQSLLMVSALFFDKLNDRKVIDSLLKTDFLNLPQKPQWVDGSGLSRYNLFSPNDFIFLLNKMKEEFSWKRITTILPTGGCGTLSRYKEFEGKLFAKTGTLSNNIALSGYIITKKNQQLIFSILIGNHQADESKIRDSIESFIKNIIEKY